MLLLLDPLARFDTVAQELGWKRGTVKWYVVNIYSKLCATNRYEAVCAFVREYPQYKSRLLEYCEEIKLAS